MATASKPAVDEHLDKIRHSLSHVMAWAVRDHFGGDVKFAIGPTIEDGFYYDFGLPRAIVPEDLDEIAKKMRQIVAKALPVTSETLSFKKAREMFKGQPFKIELIDDLEKQGEKEVSTYTVGEFTDLCKGPHVENLKEIKPDAFRLQRFSGAYWRGDSKRPMLQRIYGVAFNTKPEVEAYLKKLEEAEKRDHRTLGVKLDLFSHNQKVGQGLALWHPKGGMIRFLLEKFSQTAHILNGYQWVYTPHIGRSELWETSGHLVNYKESMYSPLDIEGEEYYLKPMNCPFHIMIYNSTPKSYRDLPVRMAEFGTVYRYELSGTLHGLTRVRGFTQDDAHIFCTPEQAYGEVLGALQFSLYILRAFGLNEFKAYIATRPDKKAIGEQKDWDNGVEILKKVVKEAGLEYEMDEGGGAFYGPKIDLKIKDMLGREWQCSTIQFDWNLPGRFGMYYIAEDGQKHTPFMVHRALFGSLERFFAVLIEHYGGDFPLWFAPVQIGLVPIEPGHVEYAEGLLKRFKAMGLRVVIDKENSKMNAKIRNFELEKVPLILVIGGKEVESGTVNVRSRRDGNLGALSVEDFLAKIKPDLDMGVPKYLGD